MAEEEGEEIVVKDDIGGGALTEAYAVGLQPLEFKLVAISKDQAPIDPTPEALAADPGAEPIRVAGLKGQTLAWVREEGKYLVETFDGDIVGIAPANLSEFEPSPPEKVPGSFDIAFPATPFRQEIFAAEFVDVLERKKWCVVQMSSKPSDRTGAMDKCLEILSSKPTMYLRFEPDFEGQYLGRDTQLKKAMWTDIQREDEPNGLDTANELLTTVGLTVMPLCPALGFMGFTKTNGMVHTMATPEEEEYFLRIVNSEGKVVDSKQIKDHLAFGSRAKLCMMYIFCGGGGQVTFHDRNGVEKDATLSTEENQVIIWRHDLLDYTYIPKEEEFAMQSWILREQHGCESDIEARPEEANFDDLAKVPRGPTHVDTDCTTDVMAICPRDPGTVWNPHDYWGLLATGCDGIVQVPINRWDLEIYWSPEQGAPGKGYVQHFGFLDQEQMASFDASFFGFGAVEAQMIDPPARCMLEVGYECLYRGGWTREKLRGVDMATCYGYAETEFGQMVARNTFGAFDGASLCGVKPCSVAMRLQYCMGMKGPAATIETACSSSLTATALMHTWLRPQLNATTLTATRKHYEHGLACGSNGHFDPFYTIALCGAGMLTHGGRCFTFDQTADGFVRGEGTSMMYYKVNNGDNLARLAMLCGTAMNQDGRSASLTAPHGPSQQECIRLSLREAAIMSLDIQIQELHGTGTALGDPIEVGALRATMMAFQGVVRDHPLVKTSSKSNIGHTEMCAGINGIMKCVIMATWCCSAPNIHMRLLNPHIDSNSYPVYFSNEFVEQGSEVGYHGVSSFGFGGSNARGDIWGRAQAGTRNTNPGTPPIDYSDARLYACYTLFNAPCIPKPGIKPPQAGEYDDDLDGDYVTGDPMGPQNQYFIEGSFNGWQKMEQMFFMPDKGNSWVYAFEVGDTRCEQFKLVCNEFDDAKVFPVSKMAKAGTRVLGPGQAPGANNWVIDAREDGNPQGTAYMIYFSWDEKEKKRKVWWEKNNDERGVQLIASKPKYTHTYDILPSWNQFKPLRMEPVVGGEPGLYEVSVRIGLTGHEEFSFQRDGDERQKIYPAMNKALRPSVPVRGPDIYGDDKYWSLVGNTGDKFTVQLQVSDGDISVTTSSSGYGSRTFRNSSKRGFYVTRQNHNWGFEQMTSKESDVYTLKCELGDEGVEAFQIAEDMNTNLAIYPEMSMAGQLVSQACGPDAKGDGLYWVIAGAPGASVEIILDLNQTDDRTRMVTWTASEKSIEG